MNIVMLAPFALSPKATVSARILPMASALARRGHRLTVLIPPYDHPADAGLSYDVSGVRVENVRMGPAISGLDLLATALRLARRALALRPEVLYVFKPTGLGALAAQLLRLTGIGTFALDNDDWEGRGGWLDVNPYPAAYKLALGAQERANLRAAAVVTCASDVLAERTTALRRGGEDALVFPNGPDASLRAVAAAAAARRGETRARLGWGAERVLIYAGTVPLNHDLDLAVRAIDSLSPELVASGLRLVFVVTGAGVPSLCAQVAALPGVAARASFYGFMPHDTLMDWLAAADIGLYPYRDTNINRAKCSGKVIDYMAAGLPMVLSDVGMNRVYVEDGRSGLLTPPGNAASFAEALQRLLRRPDEALAMGLAAQARLWEVFDWDRRVPMLESTLARARLRANPQPVDR